MSANSARRLPPWASRAIILGLMLLAILLFVALGGGRLFSVATLRRELLPLGAWAAAHPVLSFAGYFALYVLATGLSLPVAAPLTLGAGALFGLGIGIVLVSFAAATGASVAFLLARFLFRDWALGRFPALFERMERGLARDGVFYLISLRLAPVVPFFVVNLLAGLTRLRLRDFYWASQLGALPATVIYVNAGVGLARIGAQGAILTPRLVTGLLLLAALPIAAPRLRDALARRRRIARWPKPRRFDRDLVVIGAGTAGLVSAYLGNTLRAKVTLIEQAVMGGDCLNTGCVPSKALLVAARRGASFAEARAWLREAVTTIAPHDSAERYAKLGVDVRRGHATIETPWCVSVGGERITTRAIVIAAGAEPVVPLIPGLEGAPYATSETLWDIEDLPKSLVILGGGPIGCEMAQAFARFGSAVTLIEMADRLLVREDDAVSALVAVGLARDGVSIHTRDSAVAVERTAEGFILRTAAATLPFDRLLIATGRRPRVAGYGLEALGIPLTKTGTVETDAWLRSLHPNILACGDVAGPYQFTHAAAYQAGYASLNGLFGGWWRFRPDYRAVPAVTFTNPEVARVGLNEREAKTRGIAFEVTRFELRELDRGLIENDAEGFLSVLTKPGSDRILGATIVGTGAGEMITGFTLAIQHRLGLKALLGTIYPYPTRSEAIRAVAGAWRQNHASARGLAVLSRFFGWRRG